MIVWLGRLAFLIAAAFLGIGLFNASFLAATPTGALKLIAHRGVAQQAAGPSGDFADCTARAIEPPIHDRLENTARSIEDAVSQGADIVAVDVAVTKDKKFALFGDLDLTCRTGAEGKVAAMTLAELRTLDLGYGYTADGGATFPFRGKKKYRVPTLIEAIWAAGGKALLFNFTDSDPAQAELLARELKSTGREVERFGDGFIASPSQQAILRKHFPNAWIWGVETAQACSHDYARSGWLGRVPEACRNGVLLVPIGTQWLMPGWPNRTIDRMKRVGARVVMVASVDGERIHGLDLPEQLGKVPRDLKGFIWVEDIWNVGPALRPNRDLRTNEQLDNAEAALQARRAAR